MSDTHDASVTGAQLCAAAVARFRAEDPRFTEPYIDGDEWRDEPVPHRYVHGGFTDTDLRFSYYFPPVSRYGGRFFQPLLHVSGTEHGATTGMYEGMGGAIDFAVDSGAYLVESNMGRPTPHPGLDPSIPGYRGSAASARFSRAVASVLYGEHRPHGYVYGGSGGAFKTIACVENAPDVWDGAVPFVQGSPMSIPNVFAVQAHAMRVLVDKIPQIVDALEPGGSGDMFAGLNAEEREALAEVTRFGFPPKAWFDVNRIRSGYTVLWGMFAGVIRALDPTYFHDFWTEPGYLGANPPESMTRARVLTTATITSLVSSAEAKAADLPISTGQQITGETGVPVGVRFDSLPAASLFGTQVRFTSGAAAGRTVLIDAVVGDVVMTALSFGGENDLAGVEVGDTVELDNADYLAFQTFHRHQVVAGYDAFDQFLVGAAPIYPQRPKLVGPALARGGWGHQQSGRFGVKMIAVASMLDEAAYPWHAAWYQRKVRAAQGDSVAADRYRLWFVEHAMHGAPSPVVVPGDNERPSRLTRTISYRGVLEQAIRDVVNWVENGIAPAPDTRVDIVDAQVIISDTGALRGGIQPVVVLRANGAARADIAVGEIVEFTAEALVPAGTGSVVSAEWDFEGDGNFPVTDRSVDGTLDRVVIRASYSFAEPGVYFPALRITAHRGSDRVSPFARVQNLGRVRVVVH